ncbi:hypothetical protein [Paenibacillus rubinfantis]|uniref:hypothetical protein n=1 Tax=Paenibacillus rubinfantis TaxID=1720296 RepID=UPI00073EBD4A|nr:hypothetical protein [Paenibacillus rubinfantis]
MQALTTDLELLYAALTQMDVKVCYEGVIQEIGIIDKVTPISIRLKSQSERAYFIRVGYSFFVA